MRHPLEEEFNASAWDILSAIHKGFRAKVDVKGKLADYFLNQELERLKQEGVVEGFTWQDIDGQPDFVVSYRSQTLKIECKNVRSRELYKDPPAYKVEIQKTRNAIGGGPSRGYRLGHFDMLAACLFNHTGQWAYLYIPAVLLKRREKAPDFLEIMQPVPKIKQSPWQESLVEAMNEVLRLQNRLSRPRPKR
jgi:hypothetical protein